MRLLLFFLFLFQGSFVWAGVVPVDLAPLQLRSGMQWQVKKLRETGPEKKELFQIASPEKMTLRHQGSWLMLACSDSKQGLYTVRFRQGGKYPTPGNYQQFRKDFLTLMGGLHVVQERQVRWNKSGIVHRMDLDVSRFQSQVVTHKVSVMATKNAFYILKVNGNLAHASDFFDSFTPLS